MLNEVIDCLEDEQKFQIYIEKLKAALVETVKIKDANSDFERLPADIQYYLSVKAELEFLKRSLEKQMKQTSIPRLIELIKKGNYVSTKLIEAALEGMPDYSVLNERLSKVILAVDTIQSGVTGLWFKKDALVNLTASKRRQMDSERFEY
jgi:hypothetical protein